jgi:hypothetical protein
LALDSLEGEVQTNCLNQLRAALELIQNASEKLLGCTRMDMVLSDKIREESMGEIHRIRLILSIMRHDLSVIAGLVNRKKFRKVQRKTLILDNRLGK